MYEYFIHGIDELPREELISCNIPIINFKEGDFVVRDFKTECGYSVYSVNMFVGLYTIIKGVREEDIVRSKEDICYDDVYINSLDVDNWFYGLPAKVMRYVLHKHGMKEGVFDIQKIYKLENGIK